MRAARGGAQAIGGYGRKFGSWLALLSLLVQLVATAGHFHPEDFAFLRGGADAVALAASDGQGGTAPLGGGLPGAPAHDDCSLCFSLQLAGTSALPAALVLPLPSEHGTAPRSYSTPLRLAAAAHLLFQTRAPPIA